MPLNGRRFFASTKATGLPSPVAPEGWDRLGSNAPGHKPYGEDASRFATYWQDANTGLDYADRRYYLPGWGRFMSADPYLASSGVDASTATMAIRGK